jgi:hypothetical protein
MWIKKKERKGLYIGSVFDSHENLSFFNVRDIRLHLNVAANATSSTFVPFGLKFVNFLLHFIKLNFLNVGLEIRLAAEFGKWGPPPPQTQHNILSHSIFYYYVMGNFRKCIWEYGLSAGFGKSGPPPPSPPSQTKPNLLSHSCSEYYVMGNFGKCVWEYDLSDEFGKSGPPTPHPTQSSIPQQFLLLSKG